MSPASTGLETASAGAGAVPKVFTVLLNWNGAKDTVECARSLERVTYPNHSIVIVDNGSEVDDLNTLRRELRDSCNIIENPRNEGFCEGNNIGMRYALAQGADYVLVLNNDAVVARDFLSHLVAAAEADPVIGVVVPHITLHDRPGTIAYPRVIDRWPLMLNVLIGQFFQSLKFKRLDKPVDIQFLDGCCFLVKRQVVEATGLFDPDYFFPGGAHDLGKLAMEFGYRIVAIPNAVIKAKVAQSMGRNRRAAALAYAYWGPRSNILFARKHFAGMQSLAFLALLPLHVIVWLLAWGQHARTPATLVAIVRGIRDGYRFRITYLPPKGRSQQAARSSSHLSRR